MAVSNKVAVVKLLHSVLQEKYVHGVTQNEMEFAVVMLLVVLIIQTMTVFIS